MELISWGLFDEPKTWFDEKVDTVRNKGEGNVANLVANQNKYKPCQYPIYNWTEVN
jgi:hypothetical protein